MSSITNLYRTTTNRLTGLSSGLDIDALVKASLTAQQSKLDKANQQKTLISWQQEAYRSVIGKLSDFQSKYLDILNSSSILRKSSMNAIAASVSSADSKYVTVKASSDATASTVNINEIKSLASSQSITTNADNPVSAPITLAVDADNLEDILGQSLSITLDGVTKNITFSSNEDDYMTAGEFDADKFMNDFNNQLKNQFGTINSNPKLNVTGTVNYEDASDPYEVTGVSLTLNAVGGSGVKISSTNLSSVMGFTNNQTNYISTDSSAASVFNGKISRTEYDSAGNEVTVTNALQTGSDDKIKFTINDVDFTFNANATIKDIMNVVNASSAGVNMSYSQLNDSFTITANQTGAGDNIRMADQDGSNLLSRMFGVDAEDNIGNSVQGSDAVLTVNNVEIIRSSNTFSLDGVTYTLNETTPAGYGNIQVNTKIDSDTMVDTIKGFVDGYNQLLEELTSLLGEKQDKTFTPLTDAQKAEMSDKEIENWEAAAKKGLLRQDATISKMLDGLKNALLSPVKSIAGGSDISLSSIGIKTEGYNSSKLTIDETKLRQAIEQNPDGVMNLFTQSSGVSKSAATTSELSKQRTAENGIGQRFADIFNANINTSYLSEGALIKIAGTGKSTLVDYNSTLNKKLSSIETTIAALQKKLYADEDKAYTKWSAFETALSKLNAQSALFSSGE